MSAKTGYASPAIDASKIRMVRSLLNPETQQILDTLACGEAPGAGIPPARLSEIRKALLSAGYTLRMRTEAEQPFYRIVALDGPQHRITRKRPKARRRTLPATGLGNDAIQLCNQCTAVPNTNLQHQAVQR